MGMQLVVDYLNEQCLVNFVCGGRLNNNVEIEKYSQ